MLKRNALLFQPVQPLSYAFIVIAVSTIITACAFDQSGIDFDPPMAEVTDSGRTLIFEDEGKIAVFHGFGCAESNKDGEEDFLRVQESIDLPDYATAATVFLNGWHLEYLKSDHDIRGLGTGIAEIELADRKLNWEAGGVLADRNFDDGYSWCYYYTVIAWNEVLIDALVDYSNSNDISDIINIINYNAENKNTTALKVLPRFVHNTDFMSREPIAVLPRGYGFNWLITSLSLPWNWDHNLLQLAYNLDYSETFIQHGKNYSGSDDPSLPTAASYVDSGFVSWETKTILKDNNLRRDYAIGEIVSVLGGSDVSILQPPFTILPREDSGNCLSIGGVGVKTEEYVVENVPFEYAVPMLTGWELTYPCDDENVAEIGVWITEFQYDKPAGEPTGTLRYTISSILRDQDGDPGHRFGHRVTILGLKPVVGVGEPTAIILSPQQGDSFAPDTMVTLQGEGIDPEDGTLSGPDLMWFSDRDGFLGSGTSIQVILSGPDVACSPEYVSHTITLRVTDSDGHQATQQIVVSVGRPC